MVVVVEEEGDRAIHPQDKEGVFVVEKEEENNAIHLQDEGGGGLSWWRRRKRITHSIEIEIS